MKYDVFISYRREGGYETAKHLNDLLVKDGYRVSFDIDTLRNGDFDVQLLDRIEQCKDFILIVDKHAFDRTLNPSFDPKNDWLRRELAHALKHKKNIVPIFLSGISTFPIDLPNDIIEVIKKNGPEYNKYYFDDFYHTLTSRFLTSYSTKKKIVARLLPFILILSLLFLLVKYNKQKEAVCIDDQDELVFAIDDVVFKMRLVKGGTFTMGATSEQGNDANNDEKPTHSVTLDTYYIGVTEVTQELWKAVTDSNPSYFNGNNFPVEQVSWDDTQKFIRQLNQLTGQNFSLPTEAQWEFAARGGNLSRGYKYSGSNNVDSVAWYWYNSDRQIHPVAQKKPNELGLYDMSGNVREWCNDWNGGYSSLSQHNPIGPSSSSLNLHVLRGGSWLNFARRSRVSDRGCNESSYRDSALGLRLILVPSH